MKNELITSVKATFTETFKNQPAHIFMSPGRINIIGEHVDYNDGYVLPAAIDKYVCFAMTTHESDECTIVAKDLNDSITFSINDEVKPHEKMWVNFFFGVLHQIKEKTPLSGFHIVFSSDVPMGAGLSSSAALECGFAFALSKLYNLELSKEEIALIGQKAEHTFVGVNCGIMDQFASVFGKEDHVILLDCNTLKYEYHKADFKEYALLLLDSKVKHTHLTSGYNDRRREVEEGLALIKTTYPDVKSFRDVTEYMVTAIENELGPVNFKRCLFVVKEIKRVLDAVKAIEAHDFEKLGALMFETHQGLSQNYEVSCEEIDFLVDMVANDANVIGSRMMGGGFGGCSINLVKKEAVDNIIEKVSAAYKEKYNIDLEAYKVAISEGTTIYKDEHASI
ncbi:galactokinase [Pustulibacterium marinum]|uniref:Galactokinase n=1 Tax=Pustulibacterium marinum TaxID=1224947 RepID=A0A1I7H6A7_9FLAO|nr:galactokinase [Pustulibacterium marinum]SFU56212.1 galactokinase [Pustulibacterium marinum]